MAKVNKLYKYANVSWNSPIFADFQETESLVHSALLAGLQDVHNLDTHGGECWESSLCFYRRMAVTTLHKELSDAKRRRIKIALQKEATREVLEGGEALEGWLPD